MLIVSGIQSMRGVPNWLTKLLWKGWLNSDDEKWGFGIKQTKNRKCDWSLFTKSKPGLGPWRQARLGAREAERNMAVWAHNPPRLGRKPRGESSSLQSTAPGLPVCLLAGVPTEVVRTKRCGFKFQLWRLLGLWAEAYYTPCLSLWLLLFLLLTKLNEMDSLLFPELSKCFINGIF